MACRNVVHCMRHPSFCRVECQKLGEDLQQAYRAANQALEEIPAFEDLPKVNSKVVKELAQKTGSQAVEAFANSRGAAGTTRSASNGNSSSGSHSNGASENGSQSNSENGSESGAEHRQHSGPDSKRSESLQGRGGGGADNEWEENANEVASRARSVAQQVVTAAKEEVGDFKPLTIKLDISSNNMA